MLFGAANINLGALGIPDVTGYREHLYQVTAGKIVFPSVNGPIPAASQATPAGVTGFYTIYPSPGPAAGRPAWTRRCSPSSAAPRRRAGCSRRTPRPTATPLTAASSRRWG